MVKLPCSANSNLLHISAVLRVAQSDIKKACDEIIASLQDDAKNKSLPSILSALQFEDRTQQVLSHIIDALDSLDQSSEISSESKVKDYADLLLAKLQSSASVDYERDIYFSQKSPDSPDQSEATATFF